MFGYSIFRSFEKKEMIGLIVFILIAVLFPVVESVSMWKKHPKELVCVSESDVCNLVTYSYEHKICWGRVFSRRHHRISCSLPKYKESVSRLTDLSKISDVDVRNENGLFVVKLIDKKGNEQEVARYKDDERARYIASNMGARIKYWRSSDKRADYSYDSEHSYSYSFSDEE